ncbi:GntR family transcriptional regulator [Compostimonas suwonensis]|uniref:DNA-binding GntR family transcriptional regulator n=1 Tax=Compostimonas suwonensis TaxID=1048394 RepID=A0A2M9C3H9_9MICO|nr:GntR family transcriptional regulator [Compostimonas suwonensis]PJJ65094.1 DNA-binding GntR family transcriptional regulator [Compostimonas suwonensis]
MASTRAERATPAQIAPVRQQVSDTIRQSIFELRLRPGERLVERELIDMTGASRTSVREALRELEADGLVQRTPYRRLIVAVPSASEVTEIYEVRGLMLGLMVRHFVVHATDDDRQALVGAYEHCLTVDSSTTQQLLEAKQALYDALSIRASIANSVMASLSSRIVFFRHLCAREPGRTDEWNIEVGRIVEAILQRDEATAEAACQAHVLSATEVVFRVLEKYPWFIRDE